MVVVLIVLEVLMLLFINSLSIPNIEVLIILDVVRVDRISVAVPFGASVLAHVSGTYLSTDSGECQACGPLRTTKGI